MVTSHFFAVVTLLALFLLAIWIKRVFIDIIILGYIMVLAYMAIINNWEILFFPIIVGFGLVVTIMLCVHAVKGDLI